MKVFISWSGPLSQKVAEILKPWIKCVLQATEPFFSPEDIAKGSLWLNQISDQLADTGVGIICLTPENLRSPWILFEAGALAKGLSANRVCTLLINLAPADLGPPLSQFNATSLDKEEMLKLFSSINRALNEQQLAKEILEATFSAFWESNKSKLDAALASHKPIGELPKRTHGEVLDEILQICRSLQGSVRPTYVLPRASGDWLSGGGRGTLGHIGALLSAQADIEQAAASTAGKRNEELAAEALRFLENFWRAKEEANKRAEEILRGPTQTTTTPQPPKPK